MQIHDLQRLYEQVESRRGVEAYLISSFVTNKNHKGSVVFLDIIIDQNWYSRIQLLAHNEGKDAHSKIPCRPLVSLGRATYEDFNVVDGVVEGVTSQYNF